MGKRLEEFLEKFGLFGFTGLILTLDLKSICTLLVKDCFVCCCYFRTDLSFDLVFLFFHGFLEVSLLMPHFLIDDVVDHALIHTVSCCACWWLVMVIFHYSRKGFHLAGHIIYLALQFLQVRFLVLSWEGMFGF